MGWPEQEASSSWPQAPEDSLLYKPHPYIEVFMWSHQPWWWGQSRSLNHWFMTQL